MVSRAATVFLKILCSGNSTASFLPLSPVCFRVTPGNKASIVLSHSFTSLEMRTISPWRFTASFLIFVIAIMYSSSEDLPAVGRSHPLTNDELLFLLHEECVKLADLGIEEVDEFSLCLGRWLRRGDPANEFLEVLVGEELVSPFRRMGDGGAHRSRRSWLLVHGVASNS